MRIFVIFFLFVFFSASIPWFAAADDSDRESTLHRLEAVERRLNQALRSLEEKNMAELDLLSDLEDLDRTLRELKRRIGTSQRQLEKLKAEIRSQQQDLTDQQKEIDDLQKQVQKRLIALYKSEDSGTLKTIFTADSALQIMEDYDFLGRIVKHDRELLKDYRHRLRLRQKAIDELARSKNRQQETLADLQSEEDELRRTRVLKKRFLAAVRQDRMALDSMVEELRQRAARLTSLVKNLESDTTGEYTRKTALFPMQKGFLPWPVEGRVKVGFGNARHPELGTMIESHGIEILTEPETPIKAVWSGRVAFAKRFKGYGNLLIIDHDDGYYTLYARASRILKSPGERVDKGETVAVSGFDDSDYVYFEIRNGSKPLDPSEWIVRR